MQKNIGYRLGLSATVKDDYDNENRTDQLFKEVGPIIFKYGLEKAIQSGILVEFDFDFVKYDLTDKEKKINNGGSMERTTTEIQKMSNEEIEETFRREVSKINKKAENKINLLDNYVKNNPKILRNVLFLY